MTQQRLFRPSDVQSPPLDVAGTPVDVAGTPVDVAAGTPLERALADCRRLALRVQQRGLPGIAQKDIERIALGYNVPAAALLQAWRTTQGREGHGE